MERRYFDTVISVTNNSRIRRMPDPSSLRDSTQIVLPRCALDGYRERLEDRFTVTVVETSDQLRIIGSPVEIKAASDYLTRNGVAVA
jgi:hypothetical protein